MILKLMVLLVACGAMVAAGCTAPKLKERAPEPRRDLRAMDPVVEGRLALAAAPRDGRVIVMGQPTADQFRAFAEDGGRTVINLRTERELDALDFDQAALMDELGLRYIWMPMSGSQLDLGRVEAFGASLGSNDGAPVMLHCASGGRASGMWAAHLAANEGLSDAMALARARGVGLKGGMETIAKRIMLEVPDRVLAAVEPANLRAHVDMLAGFGTRHTASETESEFRGIGAARRWVRSAFEQAVDGSGRTGDLAPRVEFDAHTVAADGRRILTDTEVVNVVCTIPGADPASRHRLYYVLAHLDSRASDPTDAVSDAPGANDDASGVAALIELARVLSAERLDSSVILVATSGEEQGLYGARLHAQAAKKAGADIRGVLNNDTIGNPLGADRREARDRVRILSESLPLEVLAQDPDRLSTFVRQTRMLGSESDGISRQLARYIHEIGELHRAPVRAMLVFRPDRFLRGGDHTPFNELGFAGVRFCEVHEDYTQQHQNVRTENGIRYGDLPEFVDAEYLADVTRLNAVTLVHIANAPSTPSNARIIVANLDTDTTLRWDACPEPDVTGYEIVWRETTSPVWQESQDVGNTTEGTVDLSKDNWIFGVRSYDRDGYRSPVAFPMPARE
ncbi:MAG: M28 family peptidase [Planctomycetota bacterium]